MKSLEMWADDGWLGSAVNAVDAGLVQAFKIKEGGMLEGPVANVSTGGAGPNFVQFLSTGEIAATNVRSSTPSVFRPLRGYEVGAVPRWERASGES